MLAGLSAARRGLVGTLPEFGTVRRPGAPSADAYGGTSSLLTDVHTGPCRRSALSGREAQDAARVAVDAHSSVTWPYGTDVTVRDEIVIAGVTYLVELVKTSATALDVRCWVSGGDR